MNEVIMNALTMENTYITIMNELIMENTYMKHPYNGSELGYIFSKESNRISSNGEKLVKGFMIILDPDHKLSPTLESLSPTKGIHFAWTKMGMLVCMREDKLTDSNYIIHNFISKMKEIKSQDL